MAKMVSTQTKSGNMYFKALEDENADGVNWGSDNFQSHSKNFLMSKLSVRSTFEDLVTNSESLKVFGFHLAESLTAL